VLYLRGYGESDHPTGRDQYRLSYLVNDIKEIVSHLEYFPTLSQAPCEFNITKVQNIIRTIRCKCIQPRSQGSLLPRDGKKRDPENKGSLVHFLLDNDVSNIETSNVHYLFTKL